MDEYRLGKVDGMFKLKRKYLLILSCVLLFLFEHSIFGSQAIGALADCPDGISGYWNLNETTSGPYEDSVDANNGVCSGVACPSNTTGTVGNGKSFNGIDLITVDADDSFNWSAGQSFTIELWMHRDTGTVSGGLEVFIGRADAGGLNWYIGINTSGNAQALLKASDGSGPGTLTVSKDLRSNQADPTWHHVALVRNGSTNITTLYVDGELSASQTHTYASGFDSATAQMTIGALDGGNFLDNGGLDEVAIYGQALAQDEIRRHYYIARDYCSLYDSAVAIMPMGDSITTGAWAAGIPSDSQRIGYRLDLWDQLQVDLYRSDFTGSQSEGSALSFDFHHASFPGINANELEELLRTGTDPRGPTVITPGAYLDTHGTEIILLHIGTNDLVTTTTDVANILDEIDAYSKNVTVVLAQIIKQSTVQPPATFASDPDVGTFNTNLQTLAQSRINEGDKIILVGMENGVLNYTFDDTSPYNSGDMYDAKHPNPVGYPKMANKWFATLETILPKSELPAITSTAVTAAVRDEAYSYTVTATGPPSPTFNLINSPPSGMTINPTTGVIQWTPTTTGDFDVTVEATNWAGTATQPFTITVTLPNGAPVITTTAPTTATEGSTYTYAAAATDPDAGDTLTWSLTGAPAGMTVVAATGAVSWTPAVGSAGDVTYTLAVSDGTDTDSEDVTVTVSAVVTPDSGSGGGGGGGCFIVSLF